MALAGSGQAATVDAVQAYIWADEDYDDDGEPDAINHTWVPVPHANDAGSASDAVREIPRDGFLLVGVNYQVQDEATRLTWRLLSASSSEEIEYAYDVGDEPELTAEDRNVWLANRSMDLHRPAAYDDAFASNQDDDTGPNGCGGESSEDNETDRVATPPTNPCWFLIELGNSESGTAPSTDTSYELEFEVQESQDSAAQIEEAFTTDDHTFDPRGPTAAVTDVTVTPTVPGSDTTIESGQLITANVTVDPDGGPEASDSARSPNQGDIDVQACLFEKGDDSEPYTRFTDLRTPNADLVRWDQPVACEVMDHPTHEGVGAGNAVNVTNTTHERPLLVEADSPPDERFYEVSFTIPESDLRIDSSEFEDDFYLRIITRGSVGNFIVDDRENTGSGNFTVANYDVDQELDAFNTPDSTDLTVGDFEEAGKEGCYNTTDEPGTDETSPCFRARDFAPPDQAFTFPVTIENYGNVEDTVELRHFEPDNYEAGETGWKVQLVGPTSSQDSIEVSVPAGSAKTSSGSLDRSNIDPGRTDVTVKITPKPSTTTAGPEEPTLPDQLDPQGDGQRSIRLEAASQLATGVVDADRYLQAQLVQNEKGQIDFDGDDDNDDEVVAQASPDSITDVPLTIRNTGNTNGPFQLALSGDASPTCGAIGDDSPGEDQITLTLESDQNDFTIQPGNNQDITLEVQPGDSVSTGEYECELDFADDPRLVTTDPTVIVSVQGKPDIQILDVRGEDFTAANVTGENVSFNVRPDSSSTDVYIYLENKGDVALEPELVRAVFDQPDDVGGTWVGVDDTSGGDEISLSTAASPFTLPISDGDPTVQASDIFDPDRSLNEDNTDTEPSTEHWLCGGFDGADDDTDERVICQLHFRYKFGGQTALAGDRAQAKFKFQNTQGSGNASQVNVDLDFRHVGHVETTSVSESVISSETDSSLVFDAELERFARFGSNPTSSSVDAEIDLGGTCTEDVGPISSTSADERVATFRPTVSIGSVNSGCAALSGDTVTVDAAAGDRIEVKLGVTDENGTLLRQIDPVTLRVGSDTGTVSSPSRFDLNPAPELEATGTQYARLAFDAGDDGTGYPTADEGLALTRDADRFALEPFSTKTLNKRAISTNSDRASLYWTRLAPSDTPESELSYKDDSGSSQLLAADEDIAGLVLSQDDNDEDSPEIDGEIDVWGWDNDDKSQPGDALKWREGWNPLVLRVTDTQKDPIQDDEAENALELSLRFVALENGEIADTYELSTNQDTMELRSLGNGFYALDVYLPDGIGTSESVQLADYTAEDAFNSQEVDYDAAALHASLDQVETTDGDEIEGDAYWQLGDLGIVDSGKDNETGTDGITRVADGIRASEDLDDNDDTNLHFAPQFMAPLMEARASSQAPSDAWATGPGVHSYPLFLMEEQVDEGADESGFERDVATDARSHTFQPFDRADVDVVVDAAGTSAQTFALSDDQNHQGFYDGTFILDDVGKDRFEWFTEVIVDTDQDAGSFSLFKTFETDARYEPATNGLPMPLTLERPVNAEVRQDTPVAGDFDLDDNGDRSIVDLRAVPGLLVDRGAFAMAPYIEADGSSESIDFEVRDDATFTVLGDSLIALDEEDLPAETGEVDRPLSFAVSPTPSGAVQSVSAHLSGPTNVSTDLVDGDSDGVWTGSITPSQEGNYTATIRAVDTAGVPTKITGPVDVQPDAPPAITLVSPASTDGVRAIESNGTIQATVTESGITSDDITILRKTDSGGGDTATRLTAENVSFDALTDQPTTGEHPVTVNVENASAGARVHLNVSSSTDGTPNPGGFNATLSNGEAAGSVWFNATGATQLTVETNGTGGPSATFDVDVQDSSSSGFSEASLGSDEVSCEDATCEISWQPDGLADGDTLTFKLNATVSLEEGGFAETDPFDVEIDDGSPSVSISLEGPSAGSNPTGVGTSTTVSAEASDAGTGVVQMRIAADRNGTNPVTVSGSSISESIDSLGLPGGTRVTLTVTATDVAGNDATDTVDVRLDKTAPTVSGLSAQAADGSVSVSLQASDNSRVSSVQLFTKLPGQATFSSTDMTGAAGTFSATVDVCSQVDGQPSGLMEYYVSATDAFGNARDRGSRNAPQTFDLGPLTCEETPDDQDEAGVSIDAPGEGATLSGTVTVQVSAQPPLGEGSTLQQITVTDSQGDTQTLGSSGASLDTTQLANGDATIEAVVSVDDGTVTDSVTVTIDNRPCQTTVQLPVDEAEFEPGSRACVAITDPSPNATHVRITVEQAGQEFASQTSAVQQDGTYPIPLPDAPGNIEVTVEELDRSAGQDGGEVVSTQSFSATLAEAAKPVARFVTTLVLGVVVVGSAAYAAFGRWG